MTALVYPTAIDDRAMARLRAGYVIEPFGCWRWVKGTTTVGYGHFSWQGTYYQAHRFVYTVLRGAVTTFAMDHLCRNRWCVNPDHLEPVSHQENVRRGTGTHLNPERVRAIRAAVAAGGSYRQVGRLFGIDHSTVCRVVTGSRWADVADREEAIA